MAAIPQNAIPQPQRHWSERAIEASEVVTDAWEVLKSWMGRCADIILFACMIIQIIGVAPGVTLYPWLSSALVGVQIVTLDMAGIGLSSLAKHARQQGKTKEAGNANAMALTLIVIMITTLLLITLPSLFPKVSQLKTFCDAAEKALILVRIVIIVLYGRVMNSLGGRRALQQLPTQVQDRLEILFQNATHNLHAAVNHEAIAKAIVPLLPVSEPLVPMSKLTLIDMKPLQISGLKSGLIDEFRSRQKWLSTTDESGSESSENSGSEVDSSPVKSGSESGPESSNISGSESTSAPPKNTPSEPAPSPVPEPPKKPVRATPKSGSESSKKATKSGSESSARATKKATTTPTQSQPEVRLEAAARELKEKGQRVSGRALAALARVNRDTANKWIQSHPVSGSESSKNSGPEVDLSPVKSGSESGSESTNISGSESSEKSTQSHPEIVENSGSESSEVEAKTSSTEPLPVIVLGGSESTQNTDLILVTNGIETNS